jgi:hypothetical protein
MMASSVSPKTVYRDYFKYKNFTSDVQNLGTSRFLARLFMALLRDSSVYYIQSAQSRKR